MPGCFAKHVNARDRRTKKRYRSRRTAAKGSIEASILPGIITAISHNRQILLAVCAGYAQERSATSFGLRALRHLCFSTAPSALQRENAPTPKWPRRDICDNLARDNVEKASPLRIGLLNVKKAAQNGRNRRYLNYKYYCYIKYLVDGWPTSEMRTGLRTFPDGIGKISSFRAILSALAPGNYVSAMAYPMFCFFPDRVTF